MKRIFICLLLLIFKTGYTHAQLLLDDFVYEGNLSDNGWTLYETGGDALETTTGLSYTGYNSSGIGKAALIKRLASTSGQDGFKLFTEQNTPGSSVYVSFLIKVTDALASAKSGNYIMHLGYKNSAGPLSFCGRLYVKQLSTGALQFGVSNTTSVEYVTNNYPLSGTYLIIMKYTLPTSAGGNNEIKLWIRQGGAFPTLETDYAANITHTTTVAPSDANTKVNCIALKQNNSVTNVPECVVDGLRVGTTWADALLPVKLVSFTAGLIGKKVMLDWQVANEIMLDKYEIERSKDGVSFDKVGTINANGGAHYSYAENIFSDKNYYRLKMVDKDGKYTYSPVRFLNNSISFNDKIKVFPNPSNNGSITVSHPVATATGRLSLIDAKGTVVAEIKMKEGAKQTSYNLPQMVKGIYTVLYNDGTQKTSTLLFNN